WRGFLAILALGGRRQSVLEAIGVHKVHMEVRDLLPPQGATGTKAVVACERPPKCPLFGMRLTYLLAVTASILALAGADSDGPAKKRVGAPVLRSPTANEIEDSTKTGTVAPGTAGPRVVRAQILLDRARFSPGQIDGVYGDDFGV